MFQVKCATGNGRFLESFFFDIVYLNFCSVMCCPQNEARRVGRFFPSFLTDVLSGCVKRTAQPQIIFLKYVMLRTKYSTIIITKYTRYHRYGEIVQITGGPPLRLHRMPDSKAGRRKVK